MRCCEQLLKAQGHEHATPPYGLWYNYCVNSPQDDVEGVLTRLHVDGKNLALMMCVVFIWGKCVLPAANDSTSLTFIRQLSPQGEGMAGLVGSWTHHRVAPRVSVVLPLISLHPFQRQHPRLVYMDN